MTYNGDETCTPSSVQQGWTLPREATFIVPLKAGTQDPHIPLSCVSPCLPGGLQSPPTFAAERPTNLLGLIPSPNKERGPGWPTVVSSCLLWTGTTGPAGWNLTLLERAHCPVMRGPCSGHWPAQAGAQRGAGSTAPTSVIRNRAPLLQPPAVAHSWPSPHPTSAALLSPNPATHLGRGICLSCSSLVSGSSLPSDQNLDSGLNLKTFCDLDRLASIFNAHCGSRCWHFPKPSGLFHIPAPLLMLFWLPGMSFLSLPSNSYSSSKTQLRCHCFLQYGSPVVLPWPPVPISISQHL